MRRKLTDNDKKDITTLASKGYGAFAISRRINLERGVVELYIKENNIVVSEGKIKKITEEDGKKILELAKEGSSVKELAEFFGYRNGTVERYIRDNYQGEERRGRKRTPITPAMKKEIIQLYKDGMSITAIVPLMHSNKEAIIKVLKGVGLKVEYRPPYEKHWEEMRPTIARLYEEGLNTEFISKEVHISPDRICKILKEMGYPIKAGRRVIDIHNMNQDKKNRVISLGKSGASMACIIRRTGLSQDVVRKIMVEEKLFIPKNEQTEEIQEEEWQPRYNRISFETFEMNEFNKAHQVQGIKVKPIKQEKRIVRMSDGTERTMEDLIKEFEEQQMQSK